MHWSAVIGLTLGVLAASSGAVLAAGSELGPPPVILELGPIKPTPAPTPRRADRHRLISTLTVQNSPKGETLISFEAIDLAVETADKRPLLAAKTYALADALTSDIPGAKVLARDIVTKIRELEVELLRYADLVGPPVERLPMAK